MLKHICWLKLQASNWSSRTYKFQLHLHLHFAIFLCVLELLSLVVELLVIVDGGLLVLLVLGDQVVHVGLGLSELHLVHTLASVPMEESLGKNWN